MVNNISKKYFQKKYFDFIFWYFNQVTPKIYKKDFLIVIFESLYYLSIDKC